MTIEERNSDAYDPEATREHVRETRGDEGLKAFEQAGAAHDHAPKKTPDLPPVGGCPGMRQRQMSAQQNSQAPAPSNAEIPNVMPSEIQQWPVQLHLVQPGAPFFANKELVLLSTCSPVAAPDVQWRFIRRRSVAVACPKLDRTEGYVEKLGAILKDPTIPRIIIVRMEVPCCGGLTRIAMEAARASDRKDLKVSEVTVALNGTVIKTTDLT